MANRKSLIESTIESVIESVYLSLMMTECFFDMPETCLDQLGSLSDSEASNLIRTEKVV